MLGKHPAGVHRSDLEEAIFAKAEACVIVRRVTVLRRASAERLPLRWLPRRRGQRRQIALIGQGREAPEDVGEVRQGVLAVALAGDEQRVEDGRSLAGAGMG